MTYSRPTMGESFQGEKFFGGGPGGQKPLDLPSRIGSRIPSYQASHSQMMQPISSQVHLETTQLIGMG